MGARNQDIGFSIIVGIVFLVYVFLLYPWFFIAIAIIFIAGIIAFIILRNKSII